jgi:hypothetical protein
VVAMCIATTGENVKDRLYASMINNEFEDKLNRPRKS